MNPLVARVGIRKINNGLDWIREEQDEQLDYPSVEFSPRRRNNKVLHTESFEKLNESGEFEIEDFKGTPKNWQTNEDEIL